MCGINGIIRLDPAADPVSCQELIRTRDYMIKRGPDAAGEWISSTGEAGLGHRRLAIIDLSPAGNQPMCSADGRYQIVFNGEIYNFWELREELQAAGAQFESKSDTEVILKLYERDGVEMLKQLRGMYTLAIWDDASHCLLLARDPYGIKPLYYSTEGKYLRFASQVKALEASGAISSQVEPKGIVGFLLWGSVPEPFTLRRAIRALPAGTYLTVQAGKVNGPFTHYQFCQARSRPQVSAGSAVVDSVRSHLVSDVPVAVFLSAGLDSSLLAALASRLLPIKPITFTLSFDSLVGTERDEGPLAAAVARSLGTEHVECRVRHADFPDLWERALYAMDQPSIDGFNSYVISQVAAQAGLKVVLSGLGGDELFGSYPSFHDVPNWWHFARYARRLPGLAGLWPRLARQLSPFQPKLGGLLEYGGQFCGSYFLRRGLFLPQELDGIIGHEMASAGLSGYDPFKDLCEKLLNETNPDDTLDDYDTWQAVHVLEWTHYMRNQLLRDADWASMAHSLELRAPFVDVWLREELADLDFEPARSQGKAAFVRSLAPELPRALWTRPKSGFSFPISDWLDTPPRATTIPSWGQNSRKLAVRVLDAFM